MALTKDGAYDKALFCRLLTLCIISVSKFEVVCYKTGLNFKISNKGWVPINEVLFVVLHTRYYIIIPIPHVYAIIIIIA